MKIRKHVARKQDDGNEEDCPKDGAAFDFLIEHHRQNQCEDDDERNDERDVLRRIDDLLQMPRFARKDAFELREVGPQSGNPPALTGDEEILVGERHANRSSEHRQTNQAHSENPRQDEEIAVEPIFELVRNLRILFRDPRQTAVFGDCTENRTDSFRFEAIPWKNDFRLPER